MGSACGVEGGKSEEYSSVDPLKVVTIGLLNTLFSNYLRISFGIFLREITLLKWTLNEWQGGETCQDRRETTGKIVSKEIP